MCLEPQSKGGAKGNTGSRPSLQPPVSSVQPPEPNRHKPEIRNRYNPLATNDITFSNRNKKHVSAKSRTPKFSAARFPAAPDTFPSCPCTTPRTAHPTRKTP